MLTMLDETSFTVTQAASYGTTTSATSSASESRDLRYGWTTTRPTWLQWLNNISWAVLFLSVANCLQSLTAGLLGVVLTSIEKQFDLTSSQSAWIASAYEIGALPVLLVCSLLGTRIHRPVSVALGLLSVAVGCLLFFLPQFVSPPYVPQGQNRTINSLCYGKKLPSSPSGCAADHGFDQTKSPTTFLPVFIIARLLIGMGSVPIYTIAINFIDDCSTREKSATYCGLFMSMAIVGPALGYVFGAASLQLFTDFYRLSSGRRVDYDDPLWVGAWWLPYTFLAALCLLVALPMSGYPIDLPGAAWIRSQKTTEAHNNKRNNEEPHQGLHGRSCSELLNLIRSVVTNPTYIFLSVFSASDNFLLAGFTSFGPKYFQFEFGMTESYAGALFGAVLLPAGAGGTIFGGLIIEKMQLSCRQIIKMVAVLSIAVTFTAFIFLLRCDSVAFAGINVPFNVDTCVTDQQASFAIAAQGLMMKILGTIPGPLLMGVAFDSTCILWQPAAACGLGSQGSCVMYDNEKLANNFLSISIVVKFISLVAVVIAASVYKTPADEETTPILLSASK